MTAALEGEWDIENRDFVQDDGNIFCGRGAHATYWLQQSLLPQPVMLLLRGVVTVSRVGDGAGQVAFYYSALLALSFYVFCNRAESIRTASHVCLSLDSEMEN